MSRRKPIEDRFFDKVSKSSEPNGCWLWTAAKFQDGYGHITDMRRSLAAHRVSWEFQNGPIPEGLSVLHRCDNPACVRPDHLFLGSQSVNMSDMVAKGRQSRKFGLKNGRVKLTPEDIIKIRSDYASGAASQQALADQYHISNGHISRIARRASWAHIP